MQESVIYQDILQKGQQRGEVALIMRQLTRRFSAIAPELQTKIQQLSIPQLEDLGETLLDFSSVNDLIAWLETQEE
jgi:predicted transposase YdaD